MTCCPKNNIYDPSDALIILHWIILLLSYPTYSVLVLLLKGAGTAIHEFFHALGAFHEQSRYDRDSHVIINTANIRSGMEGNFAKQSTSNMNLYGTAYSYESIMHYGPRVSFIHFSIIWAKNYSYFIMINYFPMLNEASARHITEIGNKTSILGQWQTCLGKKNGLFLWFEQGILYAN